ncbi:lysyl-tRNA synthetase class I [Crossiella equi]|uniref:Lysine--tRNA ligase n=2 Tax=Crossiella equi TaxID=130796 RepID=A0ABS5AB85_9PSEU|nr:hypothetical protein [Crossiella equi]MBP2473586.1 lysyl-tRNA synthetase class I [Crossiella equi]
MPPRDWCATESAKITTLLRERGQTEGPVLFGAGFGPSGLPHIGTLCEVIRTSFVRQAFTEATGRPTRLIVTADDMDALRKVPDGFPNRSLLTRHLGLPLHRVPDPFEQHESLSTAITTRLRRILEDFEVDCELTSSAEAYSSGKYDDTIRRFLADLPALNALIGASVGPVRRESYSILMPVSQHTGRIIEHTRVLAVDPAEGTLTYEIPADLIIQRPDLAYGVEPHEYYAGEPIGEPITISALGGACKLQWKADWAMRLLARGTAYEMHGEDLTSSAQVVRQLFTRLAEHPPILFAYGLFLDDRGHKISKSRGNGFSLPEAQDYLSHEALRLLLYRKPRRPRRFAPALTPAINDAVRHEQHRATHPRTGEAARLRLHRIGLATPTRTPADTQPTGPAHITPPTTGGITQAPPAPGTAAQRTAPATGTTARTQDETPGTPGTPANPQPPVPGQLADRPGAADSLPVSASAPSFTTLIRILAACAPVDFAAAVEFLARYGRRVPHPELVRAWNFHEARRPTDQPWTPSAEEAVVLRRVAEVLESAPPSEVAARLRRVLIDHGLAESCRTLYLALLGRPHGPRLATWVRLTGPKRCLRLLRESLSRTERGGNP